MIRLLEEISYIRKLCEESLYLVDYNLNIQFKYKIPNSIDTFRHCLYDRINNYASINNINAYNCWNKFYNRGFDLEDIPEIYKYNNFNQNLCLIVDYFIEITQFHIHSSKVDLYDFLELMLIFRPGLPNTLHKVLLNLEAVYNRSKL